MGIIFSELAKVTHPAGRPNNPPTHQELSVALQTALKTGDWAPFARTIVQSSRMEGRAGEQGGPVSVAINYPSDNPPQSLDPMGHLKADVSTLGSGRTPLSKADVKYEVAKAVVSAVGAAYPALAKAARA